MAANMEHKLLLHGALLRRNDPIVSDATTWIVCKSKPQ